MSLWHLLFNTTQRQKDMTSKLTTAFALCSFFTSTVANIRYEIMYLINVYIKHNIIEVSTITFGGRCVVP